MAKVSEQRAMLDNMMSTFGGLANKQLKETAKKEEKKVELPKKEIPKEEPKAVIKKEETPAVVEEIPVKEVVKPVEMKPEEPKEVINKEEAVNEEPVVKEIKKPAPAFKKKKNAKETILTIISKGYELNEEENKKQTSIYLSEEAIKALDNACVDISKSIKIRKSNIIALLVKDFDVVYEGKQQEVFNLVLEYHEKDLKKATTNWTPSTEIK